MKITRTLFLLALALVFIPEFANATIRRVDSNPANGATYTTLQDAVTASVAGDTIHLAGAALAYGGATVDKMLVIIGPGFFLGENPDTQAQTSPAIINATLAFVAGSSGSFVMGCTFDVSYGITLAGGLSNIVIKRNHFRANSTAIQFNTTNAANNNIIVQQNYFAHDAWTHSFSVTNNGLYLLNNFVTGTIHGLNNSQLIVKNNVIKPQFSTVFTDAPSNSIIENNIIIPTGTPGSTGLGVSNQFRNNICSVATFGTADGNQASVSMATVFVIDPAVTNPTPHTTDSRWQLAGTSPALAAGSAGEDCGMFGGTDPYVLSGLPPIPAIYDITAPTSATQSGGLNVTIKAKSHQ